MTIGEKKGTRCDYIPPKDQADWRSMMTSTWHLMKERNAVSLLEKRRRKSITKAFCQHCCLANCWFQRIHEKPNLGFSSIWVQRIILQGLLWQPLTEHAQDQYTFSLAFFKRAWLCCHHYALCGPTHLTLACNLKRKKKKKSRFTFPF